MVLNKNNIQSFCTKDTDSFMDVLNNLFSFCLQLASDIFISKANRNTNFNYDMLKYEFLDLPLQTLRLVTKLILLVSKLLKITKSLVVTILNGFLKFLFRLIDVTY